MSSLNRGSPARRKEVSYSLRRSESEGIRRDSDPGIGHDFGLSCAAVLARLDSRLLYAMRTRFHGPTAEAVGKGLGRIGEYGAVWLVIGIVLAFANPDNGEDWIVAGILGPVASGLK